jgi:hypothetical protein
MELSLDDRLRVSPDVVFRDIEGEAVLLHLERGTYFGLDPIGTRVWQALVEHGSVRPAIAALLDEYDVAADTLEADLRSLLADLSAHDLVRRA